MKKEIRIGTRDSELALWQAKTVQNALEKLGHKTTLVPVKSTGDLVLDKPLYEFGITGIFTKTLDIALLADKIDIAVHSMKDVPTLLPEGIVEAAILKRGETKDLLIHREGNNISDSGTIATGSLRRKAQWLSKYPKHQVVNLRGNLNTRLKKLRESKWDGAIFAAAGLQRIDLKPGDFTELDWMIPAPAQGAMLVVSRKNDGFCRETLSALNDKNTEICVHAERDFLRTLEGGCTAPIGALAVIEGSKIKFRGILISTNGEKKFEVEQECSLSDCVAIGRECAEDILGRGGSRLMEEIKNSVRNL